MYVAFWSVTVERRRFKGTSVEPTVNSPLDSTTGGCRSPSWKQRFLSLRYVASFATPGCPPSNRFALSTILYLCSRSSYRILRIPVTSNASTGNSHTLTSTSSSRPKPRADTPAAERRTLLAAAGSKAAYGGMMGPVRLSPLPDLAPQARS